MPDPGPSPRLRGVSNSMHDQVTCAEGPPSSIPAELFGGFRGARLSCVIVEVFAFLAAAGFLLPGSAIAASGLSGTDLFERHIRPVLVSECVECHGADKSKGGLRLDFRDGLLKGGATGPALVPGRPEESLIIRVMRHAHPDLQMPKGRPRLSESVVGHFAAWIAGGAPDPRDQPPTPGAILHTAWEDALRVRRTHWSLQPPQPVPVPAVRDGTWSTHVVDRFLLAELESRRLRPAVDAPPETWFRRTAFALTGLPPSVEDLRAFLSDTSPPGRERAVDRLLASPHFGERWARHWMDLVRFAETYGHEQDFNIPHAWRYRDYLIRAFNADVPYHQFVTEHLAGDLLDPPRRNPEHGFNESVIATGFWYLHQATHAPVDPPLDEADRIDNQIDVMSKTFLGLTVACARCHDHKFDAISTADYYSLSAYLRASRQDIAFLDPDGTLEAGAGSLGRLHAGFSAGVKAAAASMLAAGGPTVASYLMAAREVVEGPSLPGDPGKPPGPVAHVAAENGLNPEVLGRWVQEMTAPAAGKPGHPLHSWTEALASARSTVIPSQAAAVAPVAPVPAGPAPVHAELFPSHEADPDSWYPSGEAFRPPALRADAWRASTNGPWIELLALGRPHSGLLAGSLQGTLRSPSFTLGHTNLHLRLAGSKGQVRLIISRYGLREFNPLLFERTFLDVNTEGRFSWFSITSDLARHRGRTAYLEFIDAGDGHLCVDRIVGSDSPLPPAEERVSGRGLNPAAAAGALEAEVHRELEEWVRGTGQGGGGGLLGWVSGRGLIDWGASGQAIATAAVRMREASGGLPAPMRVLAMTDGTPETTRTFLRGDPKTPGAMVSRRFLEVVSGPAPARIQRGSGRLELARELVSERNPLLHRVLVNRVWAHLFGRGLVATVDNFGAMGQTPSHPALLDHLALSFRQDGGSVKRLIRSLVLSRAYGMSSTPRDPASEAADPDNVLLHRMNLVRLEGEAVRDSLLAAAGRLDSTMFGPSVPTHFTPFMGDRMWVRQENGPMDGNRRRSIYLETRRNFLNPMMLAFDLPLPDTTVGRRNRSNVPAQALALMNDPFVKAQADAWAAAGVRSADGGERERIEGLYLAALSRPPRPEEMESLLAFLRNQAGARGVPHPANTSDAATWSDLCHLVFMHKEFIHIP